MHLLEPWFQGKAYLEAATLGGVFSALAQGAALVVDEITNADASRAFHEYADRSSKAITAQLAAGYEVELDEEGRQKDARLSGRAGRRRKRRRASTRRR